MDQLDLALRGAFRDYRLSKNEAVPLYECLIIYKGDAEKLKQVQIKAFALVNEYLQRQPTFDAHAFGWLENVINLLDEIKHPAH